MDKVKAIILTASPWALVEEKTGAVREGISLQYVITDNLSPVINENGSMGYEIAKESVNIGNVKQLVKVPGLYEFTYDYTIKKGKPALKLKEVKFISEVGV